MYVKMSNIIVICKTFYIYIIQYGTLILVFNYERLCNFIGLKIRCTYLCNKLFL